MSFKDYPLTIPGLSTDNLPYVEVRSPYGGEVVGRLQLADEDAALAALAFAKAAFGDTEHWLPGFKRAEILSRMADLVGEEAEELALLIAKEGGKPLADARIEIARAENGLRLCAEEAPRIHGQQIPMQGSAAALGRVAFTLREPIGVVVAVSAFNHPFNLIVHQVGTAVAAGCPVLVKPAPDTPLSCLRFIQLLHHAGLPEQWALAVPCSNEVAQMLVTSSEINFFSFIGSARVGWHLRSKLAPGVRCALEHGGAAPVVVDSSADIADLIPLLVKGGYYHAGQVCVSVQRVFVHESIKAELIVRLKEAVEALNVGDPALPETEVGPLIRAGEVERVHTWVSEAVAEGATLVTGGEAMEHQCHQPTLLADVPYTSRMMTEEVFGPVVCVNGVKDMDEAVARANGVAWNFQAAVFAQDIDVALGVASRLKGAAVMINDHTAFRVDWMPFGGRGPSGLSMGGIAPAIDDLTEEKLIAIRVK
jgi:acyl-CoA reductase-like NAD-dependent aldehyde dehydrogenase